MGFAYEILSFLARDRRDSDDHLHRNMGFQVGRFTDAGNEEKQGSLEEKNGNLFLCQHFRNQRIGILAVNGFFGFARFFI